MNKTFAIVIALSAVAAAACVGCGKKASDVAVASAKAAEPKPAAAHETGLDVRFESVVERRLPAIVEANGSFAADESSEVASMGTGLVQRVDFDVGTRVRKGDVLVKLDPRDAKARLDQAVSARAQAEARLGGGRSEPGNMPEVRLAREAVKLAEEDAARAKALLQAGSGTQAVVDQATSRLAQSRAQAEAALNAARQGVAGISGARAAVELATKALGDTEIRAPFDGVIGERRVNQGEFVAMGRAIAVLLRDDPLRLKVDLAEVDAARVALDAEVTIGVATWPDKVFKGKVKRIGAALKVQSRALPIEVEVSNSGGALKPGMFARAEIALPRGQAAALLVPGSAVGTSGSASRVFILAGDRVVERIVTVGRTVDGLVEIRGALKVEDLVASTQVAALIDGTKVTVSK